MINFNCEIKNRQTQIEGKAMKYKFGATTVKYKLGPGARKQKIPKTNATNKYTCQEKVF